MSNVTLHKQFTTPKNDINILMGEGRNIEEIIESLNIPKHSYSAMKVFVGDKFVEEGMYKFVRPKEATQVKILIVPEGDDIFPIIAMIAISVAAPYLAGAITGTTGFGTTLLTLGITIVGSLIVNAMFPPPEAPQMGTGADGSRALTIAGSRNDFPYDKPVNRVYGKVKFYPPHAAQPYTISGGGDQYLYMLFDLGYGPVVLTDLKFGDTLITEYTEVEYTYHEAINNASQLRYFTNDVDIEVVNVELNDGDPSTNRTTSTELNYAQFDLFFSNGLYGLDANANKITEEVTFNITARDHLGVLIADTNVDVTVLTEPPLTNVTKLTTTDFKVSSNSDDGFSMTFDVRIINIATPDFITVEVGRISSTTNGISTVDTCVYSTFRTFRIGVAIKPFRLIDPSGPTYADHTMVEMRIKATDQLNGIVDNFNCIASAKLRTLVPSTGQYGQVENLLQYPEEVGNSPWVTTAVTVTPNAITAPDGTLTADLTDKTVANANELRQIVSVTKVDTLYTFSVYLKKATSDFVTVAIFNNTSNTLIQAVVADLSSGEWERIIVSGITNSTDTDIKVIVHAWADTTDCYVWGAFLHEGPILNYIPIAESFNFSAPVETDNPAWVYADILTGTMNQRPKEDERVNWNELKRWADFCDTLQEAEGGTQTKAHTCNFVLDYSVTIFELLKQVASVGRASPDIYDDMYSVIFEEAKTTKVQIFTNMNTSDFTSTRMYNEIPDAVRINFRDPDSDWQMRERIVYNDGFDINSAKVFEDIQAPMLTSSDEAYRNGRYWIKQAALRKEVITFKTDLEWLECKRGSFVGIQMDVMKTGGTPARIKAVNVDVVTVDTDPAMNGNTVSWFELRKTDGTIVSGPVAFYNVGNLYDVDIGITGASVGDLIVFNSSGQETYDLLIKEIDVNVDQTANITCVEYVPALYDLASEPVPTYNPTIGLITSPNDVPNILESLTLSETLTFVNNIPYITINLSYVPSAGVIPTSYNVYLQDHDTFEWIFQGNTTQTTFTWGDSLLAIDNPIIGTQHCFAVVGVSANGAFMDPAIGRQACITPVGDDTIPPAPDHFVVEDTAENFRRFWWSYNLVERPSDLAGFIIRYTRSSLADWGAASPLHDGILENPPFEIRALPTGTQNVLLRAIDSSGNMSSESAVINFAMGDRIVENVLFTHSFDPAWNGTLLSGSALVNAGVLTVDTSTSGLMWNANDTVLMWNDDAALMWTSPNDSFKWTEQVTVNAGGITSIVWAGGGEVQISYVEGTWPTDFIQTENLLTQPEDMLHADWAHTATVALHATQKSTDGSLRCHTVQDNSAVASQYLLDGSTSIDATKFLFGSIRVLKDAVGKATRYCSLELEIYGSTYEDYSIRLDTSTGEVVAHSIFTGATLGQFGVVDEGDFWEIWISAKSSDALNTTCDLVFWPAIGAGSDMTTGDANSTTGTCTVFGGLLANPATSTRIRYIPLSQFNYTGANQGVVPYRSPVHLDAGTYSLLIDSPASVDVNTLTSLDWIVDVPDINEYFEDQVVSATGDTTITLTKSFTAVTNISIVLQTDGNGANSCLIMSKASLPTSFTIRCYSGGTQVQGLVDIRVQGY